MVMIIMADAGVGKTRLVRELWDRLGAESPEPLRRTGRCLAHGRGTYRPLGEVLREHRGPVETDSPELVRDRLGERRDPRPRPRPRHRQAKLHPLVARERCRPPGSSCSGELRAGAAVLLVEDLHWAQEPLLDLLERVSRDVRGPLLVIVTARPELLDARPSWGGGRRRRPPVWLERLSPREAAAMLDSLCPASAGRAPRRAGRARRRQPVLPRGAARALSASRAPADAEPLPDSVQAVLVARIDLLPPPRRPRCKRPR